MPLAYLGLGSNLGDRAENLAAARRSLERMRNTKLLRNAPTYETPPVGGPAGQGSFLNTVSLVETELTPQEFLKEIHKAERAIGRIREKEAERWGPRVIDIDILLWDGGRIEEENLTVPHPRLAERLFALLPLADLDKDLKHPGLNRTIGELLTTLTETDGTHEGIRRLPL